MISRCMAKCNFICGHKEIMAFAVLIVMKLTNAQERYVQICGISLTKNIPGMWHVRIEIDAPR
jgi:hypothetical protein